MTRADVVAQLQRGTTTVFAIAQALDQPTRRIERALAAMEAKGIVERSTLGGYRLVNGKGRT